MRERLRISQVISGGVDSLGNWLVRSKKPGNWRGCLLQCVRLNRCAPRLWTSSIHPRSIRKESFDLLREIELSLLFRFSSSSRILARHGYAFGRIIGAVTYSFLDSISLEQLCKVKWLNRI